MVKSIVNYTEHFNAARGIMSTLENDYPDDFLHVDHSNGYSTQNSAAMLAEYFMAMV